MSYTRVADGIYKDGRTGHLYERPTVAGRRTWRKLDGHTLKLAKESLAQRRADSTRARLGLAQDPYAPATPTVAEIIDAYAAAGCPAGNGRPRAAGQEGMTRARLRKLAQFWGQKTENTIDTQADCYRYFRVRQAASKGRCPAVAINYELETLSTAFEWARTQSMARRNPMSGRPRLPRPAIRHCRESAPQTATELHALAGHLFETPESQPLAWQLLLEALTGCRTSEVLALRWDAQHRGEAGYIEGDWLWLNRLKGGVNPFAAIHPGLRECITALKHWHTTRMRNASPWFVPSSRRPGQHAAPGSLTTALRRASRLVIGRHITSHGLRSFYVTARRSQGISDAQIAAEIGDRTGPAIVAQTYGDIPPNWKAGGKPILWTPEEGAPAWRRFLPERWYAKRYADSTDSNATNTPTYG